ncbi:MAG TPA: hypothetical protein VIE65_07700 [Methylobacter sp.]|jgi:hypothetical protein
MANWPWFTIITAVVAVYGAVLSTLNYCSQRRRDQQATVLAWDEVREAIPEGGFPQLESASRLTPEERTALRKMEHFSACINSGTYDVDIFVELSQSWFLQQYGKIKPHIDHRDNLAAYSELESLYQKVSSMRAGSGIFRRLFP